MEETSERISDIWSTTIVRKIYTRSLIRIPWSPNMTYTWISHKSKIAEMFVTILTTKMKLLVNQQIIEMIMFHPVERSLSILFLFAFQTWTCAWRALTQIRAIWTERTWLERWETIPQYRQFDDGNKTLLCVRYGLKQLNNFCSHTFMT